MWNVVKSKMKLVKLYSNRKFFGTFNNFYLRYVTGVYKHQLQLTMPNDAPPPVLGGQGGEKGEGGSWEDVTSYGYLYENPNPSLPFPPFRDTLNFFPLVLSEKGMGVPKGGRSKRGWEWKRKKVWVKKVIQKNVL